MKLVKYLSCLLLFSTPLAVAETTAYYGDPTFDRVVKIDVDNMKYAGSVKTASTPYPVDRAGKLDKIYAITRGAPSIDVINPKNLKKLKTIQLQHTPRSGEAYNKALDVVLLAGGNKPMSSIIDPVTDKVLVTAGKNTLTKQTDDYGGSLSSGHPFWFSTRKFAVIDRKNRKISMYYLHGDKSNGFSVQYLDSVSTPTAVHHIIKAGRGYYGTRYYAVLEGSPKRGIKPGLMEMSSYRNHLLKLRTVHLKKFGHNYPAKTMGSHHADLHPNGRHIYIGSNEGNLYVVDRWFMNVSKVIKAGKGAGHTRFIPQKDLAIVTNHKDTFVTAIDTRWHEKIKDINVSEPQVNGQILQSHTNHTDGSHYYAFASDNGIFFEIDLDQLSLTRQVMSGGTPRQGVFITK